MNLQDTGEHSAIAALSPGLQDLFSKEMIELQNGMIEIFPLYISGKWQEIATIARKMETSYVLKQSLTTSQMHELHSKLPDSFIESDLQFHYLAGMLEHVANIEKVELVGFYIAKMSEACVKCHTEHATRKFPALTPKNMGGHNH